MEWKRVRSLYHRNSNLFASNSIGPFSDFFGLKLLFECWSLPEEYLATVQVSNLNPADAAHLHNSPSKSFYPKVSLDYFAGE